MLEFRDIVMSDRDWINEILSQSDYMGCEYSFANNFAWKDLNNSVITRFKDFYIICAKKDIPQFIFPAGKGDIREVISEMKAYSNSFGAPLVLTSITDRCLDKLSLLYNGQFTIKEDRDFFDYIYNSTDLIELKGKKYHSKRNHIKKFYQNNWKFEPITSNNKQLCYEFNEKMFNEIKDNADNSLVIEQKVIKTFLDNFSNLNLIGGLLFVNDKVVGFTIGEKINSETFCVHIEKAIASIQGSYATLNNEFAKYAASDCRYINREEDLGIEGLRKSKSSYYPEFLLKKYIVTFNN